MTSETTMTAIGGLHHLKMMAELARTKSYSSPREIEDTLANLTLQACKSMKDLSDLMEQQRRSYERRLYEMRAQLQEQGGNIRSMDFVDLSRAKDMGLVSKDVAEAEFARRRQPNEAVRRFVARSFDPDSDDAVVTGWLPCRHPTCNQVVNAAVGYCGAHKRREARRFLSAHGPVDLDAQLVDQQRRKIELQAELDRTEAEVAALRRRVQGLQPDDPRTYVAAGALTDAQHRSTVLKADFDQAEKELQETERRIEAFERRKAGDGDN